MARAEQMYIESEKHDDKVENEISYLKSISSASDVKKLQRQLKKDLSGYDLGDTLCVDGKFGPVTKKFLKAHVDMNLGPDHYSGIVSAIGKNLANRSIEDKIIDNMKD